MAKKIKIGWIPVCIKNDDQLCAGSVLEPWPAYFNTNKKKCRQEVNENDGFRFRYVQVYIDPIRQEARCRKR